MEILEPVTPAVSESSDEGGRARAREEKRCARCGHRVSLGRFARVPRNSGRKYARLSRRNRARSRVKTASAIAVTDDRSIITARQM